MERERKTTRTALEDSVKISPEKKKKINKSKEIKLEHRAVRSPGQNEVQWVTFTWKYEKELSKNLNCLSAEHRLRRGGNFLSLKGLIHGWATQEFTAADKAR